MKLLLPLVLLLGGLVTAPALPLARADAVEDDDGIGPVERLSRCLLEGRWTIVLEDGNGAEQPRVLAEELAFGGSGDFHGAGTDGQWQVEEVGQAVRLVLQPAQSWGFQIPDGVVVVRLSAEDAERGWVFEFDFEGIVDELIERHGFDPFTTESLELRQIMIEDYESTYGSARLRLRRVDAEVATAEVTATAEITAAVPALAR